MAKLIWDQTGERFYETGVRNGVLYVMDNTGTYGKGVAWNGLISVTESPTGAEATPIYADDMKYLNLISAEEFEATIEAYTYPDEFAQCDGSASLKTGITIGQQARKTFGFVYRTTIGNDVVNNDLGYKLHIIYGCTAAPSEKAYNTINDSPEAITFSWDIATVPVNVTGFRPTASITIDSTKTDAGTLLAIEEKLFGTASDEPTFLLPDEIVALTPVVINYTIVIDQAAPTIPAGGGTTQLTATTTNMPSGGSISWTITDPTWSVSNGLVTAPATVTAGDNTTVTAAMIAADGTTQLGTPATVTVNIV